MTDTGHSDEHNGESDLLARAAEIRSWSEVNLPAGNRARYFIGEMYLLLATALQEAGKGR